MTTLTELIAQRSELEEKIKALTQTRRTEAIAQVRALMEENGLSLADLGSKAKLASTGEKGKAKIPQTPKTAQKVAAKYRDEAGNTGVEEACNPDGSRPRSKGARGSKTSPSEPVGIQPGREARLTRRGEGRR